MAYDDLDLRIIEYLRQDGRASLRTIAKHLGVAPATVSHRYHEMEEQGIIQGCKPYLDYAKLGYGLTAIAKIKAKGERIPEIVEALKNDRHLTHVYEITGDYDILVIGRFRNIDEMNDEIKNLLRDPRIETTNTSVVLSAVKENADLSLS